MAPKKKKKGRGRRSKTPAQTSASDPKPTATSPSTSAPPGGATTTQLIPSAPPQPTSLLPSSASQITTTQPLPSAPALPIQETHQERTSCTSDGATTTDLAGSSTAPSASAASTRTPTLLPITKDFMSLFGPAVDGAMAAMQSVKKDDPTDLEEMVVALCGLHLRQMDSVLWSLQELAAIRNGEVELKMASEALANMEVLKRAVGVAEKLLAEKLLAENQLVERIKNLEASGGSCGGSKGEGGGPDSGSGEGDGEGGGVSV